MSHRRPCQRLLEILWALRIDAEVLVDRDLLTLLELAAQEPSIDGLIDAAARGSLRLDQADPPDEVAGLLAAQRLAWSKVVCLLPRLARARALLL